MKKPLKIIKPPDPGAEESSDSLDEAAFPIVGIGASAGGLEAFTTLLQNLPVDTGMAFVLIQHLAPDHESILPELLSRATAMEVHQVTNKLPVQANQIFVIPPNVSMVLHRGRLELKPRKKLGGVPRCIDFFLESLAREQRGQAIGVVLSGTASDGTMGLEAIKAEGGITFAQDRSAKYDSMPRSAIAAGCVDFVLSPERIAVELAHLAKHPCLEGVRIPAQLSSPEGTLPKLSPARADHGALEEILHLLRQHSTVDFTLYKPATIQRRIARRMILNKSKSLESYAKGLRGNAVELDALYSDLLISVTNFFRNPEAFEELKRKVFPKLLRAPRGRNDAVRMWVPGCSTGQEAYSLAMAYTEFCAGRAQSPELQVFATDLNEMVLEKARQGLYPKSLVQDLSPERLQRFFVEEEAGFRVSKRLRQSCIFARQNLLTDPPFSRMDLISCRNVLIYIEPQLQQRFLPTLHYALKPEGFLFLGLSESIGSFTDLFSPIDKKMKIFARKGGVTPGVRLPVARSHRGSRENEPHPRQLRPETAAPEANTQREADRVTMARFAPPSVLVDADFRILQFRGATGAYLQPPSGKPTSDLLKMAQTELMLPLRAALRKAAKGNQVVRTQNVPVNRDGMSGHVNLEIIPLNHLKERCYLVFFQEAPEQAAGKAAALVPPPGRLRPGATRKTDARRIGELEQTLSETRDYLQSVREQYEAVNEELQANNEEVTSANEELQSINEELDTSKEELESANEELITVNDEMAHRNDELNHLNEEIGKARDFAHLLIDSVPTLLVLDAALRVQTGNDSFYQFFKVDAQQTEGRLIYELGNGQWNIPALRELLENILPRQGRITDYEVTHEFQQVGRRTMLLTARQVDHLQTIILSFVDITARKEAEMALQEAKQALAGHATELQRIVEERTATLRETIQELEAFSYSLVHDMRAPLRAMNSYAVMLQEDCAEQLNDHGREMLRRIISAAGRLDQLILDVLNYTRVLRDSAPLGPVNPGELLRELIESYPDWALQAGIEILDPLPLVLGHKALLAQCFSNLISNAITFAAPGLKPRVKIWATVRDRKVRIQLQDNGIGISPERHSGVFSMFQRIHATGEHESTDGLGLAIVRRAVERMGGQVGFASESGQGSTFWIELPSAV